jgi:hypothetical protein
VLGCLDGPILVLSCHLEGSEGWSSRSKYDDPENRRSSMDSVDDGDLCMQRRREDILCVSRRHKNEAPLLKRGNMGPCYLDISW